MFGDPVLTVCRAMDQLEATVYDTHVYKGERGECMVDRWRTALYAQAVGSSTLESLYNAVYRVTIENSVVQSALLFVLWPA